MSKKRKRFTAEFKPRVALDVLTGELTLFELASKPGVHANQISKWKKLARAGCCGLCWQDAEDPAKR